jgi:two-component system, chemotaxis family, chemotaxis protein CheY
MPVGLIVEDSSTMRVLLAAALNRIEGFVVVEATDGQDALAKLAETKADVILTDLDMPVMDGFTFIEKLRARPELAQIPIIVLTTEGELAEQDRARALAVASYVTKPIRPDDVTNAVKQVLANA